MQQPLRCLWHRQAPEGALAVRQVLDVLAFQVDQEKPESLRRISGGPGGAPEGPPVGAGDPAELPVMTPVRGIWEMKNAATQHHHLSAFDGEMSCLVVRARDEWYDIRRKYNFFSFTDLKIFDISFFLPIC